MCMIDGADFSVTVLQTKTVKAKKPHKCNECYRIINPGENYLYESYVGDGFATHKTCVHCLQAREFLNGQCHGFIYGGILEDVQEHYGIQAARLAVGMRRKWLRFDSKGLMEVKA